MVRYAVANTPYFCTLFNSHSLDTIQQDIASLPPDTQQIIVELVEVLKKRYLLNQHESSENSLPDWSDFIGCIEAETDLSKNYKNYLDRELNQKF
ncbi:MAG: hypothetical protein HEQ20_02200 [Aphanizomenon flos-aquae KM1D3_PB]|nr:MAG: hypothetical protein HEQ20_02200 [Aphanizomenon flos-aquae KM1D3_PB]